MAIRHDRWGSRPYMDYLSVVPTQSGVDSVTLLVFILISILIFV